MCDIQCSHCVGKGQSGLRCLSSGKWAKIAWGGLGNEGPIKTFAPVLRVVCEFASGNKMNLKPGTLS